MTGTKELESARLEKSQWQGDESGGSLKMAELSLKSREGARNLHILELSICVSRKIPHRDTCVRGPGYCGSPVCHSKKGYTDGGTRIPVVGLCAMAKGYGKP